MSQLETGPTLLFGAITFAGYALLIWGAARWGKEKIELQLGFGFALLVLGIFSEAGTLQSTELTGGTGVILGLLMLSVLCSSYAVAGYELNWLMNFKALCLLSTIFLLGGSFFLWQPWTRTPEELLWFLVISAYLSLPAIGTCWWIKNRLSQQMRSALEIVLGMWLMLSAGTVCFYQAILPQMMPDWASLPTVIIFMLGTWLGWYTLFHGIYIVPIRRSNQINTQP